MVFPILSLVFGLLALSAAFGAAYYAHSSTEEDNDSLPDAPKFEEKFEEEVKSTAHRILYEQESEILDNMDWHTIAQPLAAVYRNVFHRSYLHKDLREDPFIYLHPTREARISLTRSLAKRRFNRMAGVFSNYLMLLEKFQKEDEPHKTSTPIRVTQGDYILEMKSSPTGRPTVIVRVKQGAGRKHRA